MTQMPCSELPGDSARHGINDQDDRLMAQVWSRMQAIYSGLWRSMNNPTDDMRRVAQREWLGAIRRAGLSMSQVDTAITACANGEKPNPGMPPTLPDFIAMASPHATPAHKPFRQPPLPQLHSDEQKRAQRARLAKIRKLLG
jgi:hypothetical protein